MGSPIGSSTGSTRRPFFRAAFAVAATVFVALTATTIWTVKRQGLAEREFAAQLPGLAIKFDDNGIPTIAGGTWQDLAKGQGFVVASERMWQMDLIRRKAAGRLAEWFGPKALPVDIKAQREGRLAAVAKSVEMLPKDQREFCDAYAAGVNQFIDKFPGRWGIEYTLTGQKPEAWNCADSLLVVLSMSEMLASTSEDEFVQAKWRKVLSPSWQSFLYTYEHPWNKPFFNERERKTLEIPSGKDALPEKPLAPEEYAFVEGTPDDEPYAMGSNSWAWNGPAGSYLVNDPHLGQSTPQLWYAVRMKTADQEWVVGVALPGLPGVVLGMNNSLAWAFTNVGEDVDDLLEEELSADGSKYVAKGAGGSKQWREIETYQVEIPVKGANPHTLEVRATHRGPLFEVPEGSGKYYSRQWLPLKPGRIGIPTLDLDRARNWDELNKAADRFTVPAQNVLIMDRLGNIGYRATGTGVIRKVSGRFPQPAAEGEWAGFAPPTERPRMWIEAEKGVNPTSMATANQRMWVDRFGHNWYGEDREERINSVLASRNAHTQQQMLELQLDVTSRFRRELMRWVALNGVSSTEQERELQQKWIRWDGSGESDPAIFTDSIDSERMIYKILLGRLRDHFKPDLADGEKYRWQLERAWLLTMLTRKGGFKAFGLDDADLATAVMRKIAAGHGAEPYAGKNAWNGQHPFVKNVPVAGWFFRVKSYPQYGYADLVRAEKPDHGPSVRMIWNLRRPEDSEWMFPVGQSGHVGSRHYANFRTGWTEGTMMKAIPAGF